MDLRLPKGEYDRFKYIIENPLWLKLLYSFGIISWILVLYGYLRFLSFNIWYLVFFGPILAVLSIYNFLNYGINLFYKKFDLKLHEKIKNKFWKKGNQPLVDIFLPVCGEDITLINNSFSGVKNIDYKNKKVYVLDDLGDPKVKKLASKFNFIYLSRQDKGVMRKAGNLKYGFEHSKGEFYAVFDADFVPNRDFIKELLPYTADDTVGIVQSPQYFHISKKVHDRSPIEYGSANLQEDFYRIIQRARDSFGGAICVGSNGIYRRRAIQKIGGPTQVDHGEDVHTGVDVISAGYKIKYIPLILAKGLCPDTLQAFYKQHNRWCSSSTGMFLSGKVLKSNLTLAQKLCYYCGFLYYICQMFYFVLPVVLFILLGLHGDTINIFNALPFFPYIFFGLVLLPLARVSKPKAGTYLATMTCVYTHTLTVLLRFIGRAATWVPTNTIEHGIERGFEFINNFSQFFLLAYFVVLGALIYTWHLPLLNWTFYSVIFWVFWNIALHSYFSLKTYGVIYKHKEKDAVKNNQSKRHFILWKLRFSSIVTIIVVTFSFSFYLAYKDTAGQSLYASRGVILTRMEKERSVFALTKKRNKAIVANSEIKEVGQVAGITADKYIVQLNDSLWNIAIKEYKNGNRWVDIWNANPKIINPNLIYPGFNLSIPRK